MNTPKHSPAGPVQAATVILTRELAGELQVYLLKRNVKSGFMAGNFVFPGGTVDKEDRKFNVFEKHIDLNRAEIYHRLGGGLPEEEALSFAVAAIRETLEEAGVFLANRDKNSQAGLEHACGLRLSENLTKDWFVKLVVAERWRLTLSALTRWSHWITPELMKRRFDTRFLMTTMPSGQSCLPDSRETVQGLWVTPEEGLKGNLAGKIPLSPPTLVTLHELLQYPNMQALQAVSKGRKWGQTLMPRLVPLDRGAMIVEPWDPMYRKKELIIDPDDLAALVLPVGAPFSRIWFDEGLWKPVGLGNAK
jgi:8-oxo-dGTP pyrophosphatase MutT (NUDIX family)